METERGVLEVYFQTHTSHVFEKHFDYLPVFLYSMEHEIYIFFQKNFVYRLQYGEVHHLQQYQALVHWLQYIYGHDLAL